MIHQNIAMGLSFFPKFFHLQLHSHLPQLNFSVSLLKIQHYDTLKAYIPKKISRIFKPSHAPIVAASEG